MMYSTLKKMGLLISIIMCTYKKKKTPFCTNHFVVIIVRIRIFVHKSVLQCNRHFRPESKVQNIAALLYGNHFRQLKPDPLKYDVITINAIRKNKVFRRGEVHNTKQKTPNNKKKKTKRRSSENTEIVSVFRYPSEMVNICYIDVHRHRNSSGVHVHLRVDGAQGVAVDAPMCVSA